MKRLLCCLSLLAVTLTAAAQAPAPRKAPASPPAMAVGTIGGRSLWIAYSSPAVKGRAGKIFSKDGLISKDPHYPVWRAGANSATTMVLSGKIKIGTVEVPPGAYTLFVNVADPDKWTLIISKKTGEWGLSYDDTADLGQTPLTMSVPLSAIESLKWEITDKGDGTGMITLGWENHVASVVVDAK